MVSTFTRTRHLGAVTAPMLVLACLLLASCGGSSTKTTASATKTSTSAKSKTSTSPDSIQLGSIKVHASSFGECLKKNGVSAPAGKVTPGSPATPPSGVSKSQYEQALRKCGGPPAQGLIGGFSKVRECLQKDGITLPASSAPDGHTLPKGVSEQQFQEALKKCREKGGGGGVAGGFGHFNSSAVQAELNKFAACMREHGVNVPKPNTSGHGPIFSTKGVNTRSAVFRAAESKCISDLRQTYRASPGGAAGSSTTPTG